MTGLNGLAISALLCLIAASLLLPAAGFTSSSAAAAGAISSDSEGEPSSDVKTVSHAKVPRSRSGSGGSPWVRRQLWGSSALVPPMLQVFNSASQELLLRLRGGASGGSSTSGWAGLLGDASPVGCIYREIRERLR